jgi:hypothetical protein
MAGQFIMPPSFFLVKNAWRGNIKYLKTTMATFGYAAAD